MRRRRGKSAETYGYDVVAGFKTVGFRSNAPADPICDHSICAFWPESYSMCYDYALKMKFGRVDIGVSSRTGKNVR